jgi:protoporphyrinogen IX oxidase
MTYLWVKALHLVGIVSWFAGLFYLVRLFVYHAEADHRPAAERELLQRQFTIMAERLLHIIATPAMVVTVGAGITMLVLNSHLLQHRWMHLKFVPILWLLGYHAWCWAVVRRLGRGESAGTPKQMRIANEVPTILLVVTVILAVLKDTASLLQLLGLSVGLIVVLGVAIQLYGAVRARKGETV